MGVVKTILCLCAVGGGGVGHFPNRSYIHFYIQHSKNIGDVSKGEKFTQKFEYVYDRIQTKTSPYLHAASFE